MKYIIVDASTRVILTYVEDTRLSTSLKSLTHLLNKHLILSIDFE